jgi:hypothetical protein
MERYEREKIGVEKGKWGRLAGGLMIHLVENRSATGQCRQVAHRGLVLLVFGRSLSPRMLAAALFVQLYALCYCWRGCRHMKARKICTGVWQFQVLCPQVLWLVQVLPDAFNSLPLSVLCVVFLLYQSRWERIKR